ncbi:MAG: hypothetical protein ACJAQT_002735 [Akkermansiaceae bacterium]
MVKALRLCANEVPFLVKPVQVPAVIRDPFLDGLPNHKERTVCWPFGGRRIRAAAMKSEAVKISKLRLVVMVVMVVMVVVVVVVVVVWWCGGVVVWWCGGVVAFEAVDDGLAGGVPSDFFAKQIV